MDQNVVDGLWGYVLKNKDGTVDPWELIRQFSNHHHPTTMQKEQLRARGIAGFRT